MPTTTSTVRVLRVFLSSPGDVATERVEADAILRALSRSHAWRDKFAFEIVRWDDPLAAVPMDAHLSPQDAVNQHLLKPSECDIVIVILWSRMGTPLREPRKPDGSQYLSGTEWEFYDALKGHGPILLFRRLDEPLVGLRDPTREQRAEQYQLVLQFFDSFTNADGSQAHSVIAYTGEQFAEICKQTIEGVLRQLEKDSRPGIVQDNTVAVLRPVGAAQDLPDAPYPLLRPYHHPQTFAGRDDELEKLEQLVRQPQLVLGLHATSGAGKSSLLLAGLVPRLRASGFPVSMERRPGEPGLARRLLEDLLELPPDVRLVDDQIGVFEEFATLIRHARALARVRPVLILDQFDDVLRLPDRDKDEVLSRLGPLVAATARRLPGEEGFPCKWVFCYRHEFHGIMAEWLEDVLKQARLAGRGGLEAFPHDLTGDLFDSKAVPVMGAVHTGQMARDHAHRAFLRAISQPLELPGPDGRPRYALRFSDNGAERLADAFARARQTEPNAPLVPELQVVLSHLIDRGVVDLSGMLVLNVPHDPAELDQQIDDALAAHLRWALENAFPLGRDAAAARSDRARALLVLRELADARGRRGRGLTKDVLAKAFGPDGDRVIRAMESPRVRLIVQEWRDHAFVYALSHDRMAEVVTRFFESELLLGALDLDRRVVALRHFVAQRTELYLRSNDRSAIDLSAEQYELIHNTVHALIRDDDQHRWWDDCQVWFDLRQRLGDESPDFHTLVELQRKHSVDWGQIGRRVPAADINAKIFWAGPWEASPTRPPGERITPTEVLDVIECAYTVLLDSREAFYAMTYTIEEIRYRFPEHAERAQTLQGMLHRAFTSEHGVHNRLPSFRGDRWHFPDEELLGFVRIPEGAFAMGSDKGLDPVAYDEELWASGQGTIAIQDFYVSRYETTVAQFMAFVVTTGFVPGSPDCLTGPPHHPVTSVSWYEALQYCAWLEQTLKNSAETPDAIRKVLVEGWRVGLPSEPEWEKAARGTDGRTYPWGDGAVDGRANHSAAKTTAVGSYPYGASPYGLLDMSGNVWEWTRSQFKPYPYDSMDGREDFSPTERVLRGGYFGSFGHGMRAARRHRRNPTFRDINIGFRIVITRIPKGDVERTDEVS